MSTPNPDGSLRTSVSLAMIVRNGGQFLDSLLAAAAPCVDEILIGDTGSSDDSREVAVRHGARVLDVPWTDDFAAARNAVLPHCTGRWILIMDADENLCDADWLALKDVVADLDRPDGPRAGRVLTRNYVTDRHGKRGWTPVPDPDDHALGDPAPAASYVPTTKVRLFPNHPAIRFSGRLHETVEASLQAQGIRTVDLIFPVHHFGLLTDDAAKSRRYLELARRKTLDEPHNPAAWGELADCAVACDASDEALAAIDRALILDPANPSLRLTAGALLKSAGRFGQADLQLAAASASGPVSDDILAEICHLRAQIAMQQDRAPQAANLLAVALRLGPDNGHYFNTLGAWHLLMGKGQQAQQALDRARALLPTNPDPLVNLARLFQAAGDHPTARLRLDAALALDPEHAGARRLLAEMDAPA